MERIRAYVIREVRENDPFFSSHETIQVSICRFDGDANGLHGSGDALRGRFVLLSGRYFRTREHSGGRLRLRSFFELAKGQVK